MGDAWLDKLEKPEAARIVVADFCFFAGKPSEDLDEEPGVQQHDYDSAGQRMGKDD